MSSINFWRWIVVAGALTCAWVSRAQDGLDGLSGFTVPEYDDDGVLQSQLYGDFAKFLPNGLYEITNPKLEFYADEEVAMEVVAEHCIYNQSESRGESDSEVRITRKNMIVTGVGFAWSKEDERFEIFEDVKVVLNNMDVGVGE